MSSPFLSVFNLCTQIKLLHQHTRGGLYRYTPDHKETPGFELFTFVIASDVHAYLCSQPTTTLCFPRGFEIRVKQLVGTAAIQFQIPATQCRTGTPHECEEQAACNKMHRYVCCANTAVHSSSPLPRQPHFWSKPVLLLRFFPKAIVKTPI